MVQIKHIAEQFRKQLLVEYDDKPENLLKCLRMYFGFLKQFAHKDLTEFTTWQYKDLEMMIYNPKIDMTREPLETVLIYSRRGGKSRKLSIKDTFFTLLEKDVTWFAPHTDQLKQAGKWFGMNPFVKKIAIHSKNEVQILGGRAIDIGVLSEGRVASKDTNILTFDEGGWVFLNRKNYEYYKTARFMIAAADFKVINHASTPARYSVIHEAWDKCSTKEQLINLPLTSLHDVDDCYWITPEMVEAERLENLDTPWYVDQNFYCKWVNYGGTVFNKVIYLGDPKKPQFGPTFLDKVIPTHCGVDFNKGDDYSPHYLLTLTYDDSFIYVLDEYTFTDLNFLFDKRWRYFSMEVEDKLFNDQFTQDLKRMGLVCNYFGWTDPEKHQRVQDVRSRTVIIDKSRAPKTYDNLISATYDKNYRIGKLEKRTDQHGLDCLLHGVHDSAGKIYFSERGKRDQPTLLMGHRKKARFYER